jgi:hypothetical protein
MSAMLSGTSLLQPLPSSEWTLSSPPASSWAPPDGHERKQRPDVLAKLMKDINIARNIAIQIEIAKLRLFFT